MEKCKLPMNWAPGPGNGFMAVSLSSLCIHHLNGAIHVGVRVLRFREQPCNQLLPPPSPSRPQTQALSSTIPSLSCPSRLPTLTPSAHLGFLNYVETGGYFQGGFLFHGSSNLVVLTLVYHHIKLHIEKKKKTKRNTVAY